MVRIVQIVSSLSGNGGVQMRLLDNYKNMDRNQIHFDFIVHGSKIGELEEVFRKLGSEIYHVSPKREKGWLHNALQIFWILSRNKYDILQCHMEHAGVIVFIVASICRIKNRIAHSHLANLSDCRVRMHLFQRVASFLLEYYATHYFACSKDAGRWLFGEKIEKDGKLNVINNAIDANAFRYNKYIRESVRNELELSDSFIIGNVGRIAPQKNHAFLIKIFSKVLEVRPDAVLLVVGSGELDEDIKQLVQAMGLSQFVRFLGTRYDIYRLMQAMDVFLLPTKYEGLGNVLIEAQAAGLQCITSLGVVPQETKITDRIAYIPLSAPEKVWCDAICSIKDYNHTDTYHEITSAGFNCQVEAKKLEKMYEDMVNRKKKSSMHKSIGTSECLY